MILDALLPIATADWRRQRRRWECFRRGGLRGAATRPASPPRPAATQPQGDGTNRRNSEENELDAVGAGEVTVLDLWRRRGGDFAVDRPNRRERNYGEEERQGLDPGGECKKGPSLPAAVGATAEAVEVGNGKAPAAETAGGQTAAVDGAGSEATAAEAGARRLRRGAEPGGRGCAESVPAPAEAAGIRGRGGDGPAEGRGKTRSPKGAPSRGRGRSPGSQRRTRRPGAGRGGRGDDLRGDDRHDGRQGGTGPAPAARPPQRLFIAPYSWRRGPRRVISSLKPTYQGTKVPLHEDRARQVRTGRAWVTRRLRPRVTPGGPTVRGPLVVGARAAPGRPVASWANVGEPAEPLRGGRGSTCSYRKIHSVRLPNLVKTLRWRTVSAESSASFQTIS